MNSGTRITANGTDSDENITANRTRFPRTRNIREPVPGHRADEDGHDGGDTAVPTLMPNHAQNGCCGEQFT